jgi:hypothetical protein
VKGGIELKRLILFVVLFLSFAVALVYSWRDGEQVILAAGATPEDTLHVFSKAATEYWLVALADTVRFDLFSESGDSITSYTLFKSSVAFAQLHFTKGPTIKSVRINRPSTTNIYAGVYTVSN